MYIHFRKTNSVIYPVIQDSSHLENLFTYDIDNMNTKYLIASLITRYKCIFIVSNSNGEDKLIASKNHYEKKENYLYVNKSYLSFWLKELDTLNDFSVTSLLNSI